MSEKPEVGTKKGSFFKNMSTVMIGNFVTEEWMKKRINCRQTCFLQGFHCRRCLRENDLYNTAIKHPELTRFFGKKEATNDN